MYHLALAFFMTAAIVFSRQIVAEVPTTIINTTPFSVVEVLVAKNEDKKIEYARDLPLDKIPFRQRTDKYNSVGTAFFVSDTKLVSAAHVFALHEYNLDLTFYVRTMDSKVYEISDFTRYSQYRDIVEFKLKKYPDKIIPLALRENYTIGEGVCAPGNAIGEGISFRCGGQITSESPEDRDGQWNEIRFSTPISPGNSGGPLLDEKGVVLGIVVRRVSYENLNYAVPIAEYSKLSDKSAEFSNKRMSVRENTDLVTYGQWTFNTPLPAGAKMLNDLASESLNKSYNSLLEKHRKNYHDKLFPRHRMFRSYLTAQNSTYSHFGQIRAYDGTLFNWGLNVPEKKQSRIGVDQEVVLQSLFGGGAIELQKPKNEDLKSFVLDGKKIMDTLAIHLGVNRNIGGESVKISSYGQPNITETFRDELGRPWYFSLWFISYSQTYFSLFCSPVPRGVACLIHDGEIGQYSKYWYEGQKDGLNEILFSYSGSNQHWQEYLQLGDKMLPPIFRADDIKKKAERIGVTFDDFNFSFALASEQVASDEIEVTTGYSPFDPLKLTALQLSYTPEEGIDESIEIEKVYKPDDLQPPKVKQRFYRLTAGTPPYDGTLHQNAKRHFVERVLRPFDGKKLFKITCSVPLHEMSQKAEDYCKSIK